MVIEVKSGLLNIKLTAKAGIKPFSTSPNKVKKAGNLLPMRKTFVAPGFLDPLVRGSGRPNK